MENITTGHWIFAGIFAVFFIGYLVWSYRKDLAIHKIHYKGSLTFVLVFILLFFLIFIFKRIL